MFSASRLHDFPGNLLSLLEIDVLSDIIARSASWSPQKKSTKS